VHQGMTCSSREAERRGGDGSMVWQTGSRCEVSVRVVSSSAPCDRIDDDVRNLRVQCLPLCDALLDKSDPISRQLLMSCAIKCI